MAAPSVYARAQLYTVYMHMQDDAANTITLVRRVVDILCAVDILAACSQVFICLCYIHTSERLAMSMRFADRDPSSTATTPRLEALYVYQFTMHACSVKITLVNIACIDFNVACKHT